MSAATDQPPCPEIYITLAERMAAASAAVIRRYFRTAVAVDDKPDRTPVTIADREAEAAMRKVVAGAFPDHGVIGEEGGSDRGDADHVWVLDPIDGTKRFITGNAQFGTLIALLKGGKPILGVIDMPMLGERWIGATGRPTMLRDHRGLGEARVRPCADLAQAALYATTPHMFAGDDFAAFERVRESVKLVAYGSDCYGYGLVAGGFADLVIEADMGVHDYLALVPVVTGAGGVMTDWSGAPLGLESDGRVIAAGDPRLHEAALARLRAEPRG